MPRQGSCLRGGWSIRMATDVHSPRLKLERRLAAALGIAIGAAFVETLGSWWSGSLALLSDAGHVGTDAVALGLRLAALAANLVIVSLLGGSAQKNINVRGAFLHAYGDTLGSVGVVAGAVIIAFTHFVLVDTLIAIFIVALIGASTARLLRDSARIILEGTPVDLRPDEVAGVIRSIPGVRGVHDLHVWTVTSGLVVLTGHLTVAGN